MGDSPLMMCKNASHAIWSDLGFLIFILWMNAEMLSGLQMQVATSITDEDIQLISTGIYILTIAYAAYVIYRVYRQ